MIRRVIHTRDEGAAQNDVASLVIEIVQIGEDQIIGNADQLLVGMRLRDLVIEEKYIHEMQDLLIFTLRTEPAGFQTGMNTPFSADL